MTTQLTPDSTTPATTAGHAPMPGDLTDREAAILRRVLSEAPFEGADVLLDQVRMLQVDPGSTPTTRIYVLHPDAPRSAFSAAGRAKVPVAATVKWLGGRRVGDVSVWVEDGHLRALMYVWFTQHEPMTLPPADWLQLEAAPAAVTDATAAPSANPPAATAARRGTDWSTLTRDPRAALAIAVVLLALLAAAFLAGRAGAADVDAARAAGAAAGQAQGEADGALLGELRGMTEGVLAGRASTYQASFDAAAARARRARAAALASQQAAANVDNSSCPGFRDASGYWVCNG